MKAWRLGAEKLKAQFTADRKGLTPPYGYARQVKVLTQRVKVKAAPSALFYALLAHAGYNWTITEEIPSGINEPTPIASDLETRALYSPVAL